MCRDSANRPHESESKKENGDCPKCKSGKYPQRRGLSTKSFSVVSTLAHFPVQHDASEGEHGEDYSNSKRGQACFHPVILTRCVVACKSQNQTGEICGLICRREARAIIMSV
jgi:hypothetical protein